MTLLSSLIATLLGFTVVMAGASLLVSSLIRALHFVSKQRSRNLAQMLASLHYGFRKEQGDVGTPDDEASAAFVRDVLSDPALHANATLRRATTQGSTPLMREIDFISQDDLLRIIARPLPSPALPREWHVAIPPARATRKALAAYVQLWFRTAEINATGRFRLESTRLATVLSAILVVLLNLDGVQLASDLMRKASLSAALDGHAEGLLARDARLGSQLAQAEGASSESEVLAETWGDLIQVNAIMNLPELRLGWQHSAFSEHWCAYRGGCEDQRGSGPQLSPIGHLPFARYFAGWLAGLAVSTLLLSLGAPFWADRLRDVLRLRAAVSAPPRLADRGDGK